MSKLYRARSLLYRRQILQVNIRWKALDEIYKIYMVLHRSDINISKIFHQTFSLFLAKFCKNVEETDSAGEGIKKEGRKRRHREEARIWRRVAEEMLAELVYRTCMQI